MTSDTEHDQPTKRANHLWEKLSEKDIFGRPSKAPARPLTGEPAWRSRLELERQHVLLLPLQTSVLVVPMLIMPVFFIVTVWDILSIFSPGEIAGLLWPILGSAILPLGVIAGFVAVDRWLRKRLWTQVVRKPADQIRRSGRHLAWTPFLVSVVLLLIGVLAGLLTRSLMTALLFGGFGLLQAAGVCVLIGFTRRAGFELCCFHCGYPAPEPKSSWTVCSECGRDLNRPFGVVLGARQRSRKLMAMSVALLILGIAAVVAMRLLN